MPVQHVALKKARDRTAFVWWLWLWASVLFSPVLLLCWERGSGLRLGDPGRRPPSRRSHHLAISRRAYRTGDLSLVYPLARG